MADQPSRAVQDYLKAIHGLGGAERMVSPVELAARLQVRAASVTGMLKRLAEGGWIRYQSGRGARLTGLGTSEARRVIRRHRLMDGCKSPARLYGRDVDQWMRILSPTERSGSVFQRTLNGRFMFSRK